MPKSLYIDPNEVRRPKEHKIKFPEIPVMQYKKSVADELKEKNFTKEDLLHIYRDMFTIREFETMLNLVKTTGGYNGVAYNNPGPAHLSAGQEAAAVGMAYNLDTDDFIFGSHRSHGEILAKGLRSIEILSPARPVSTKVWADRCIPSSPRSASTRTTPSWAVAAPSPWVQPCTRRSTARKASSWPTSAMVPWPAVRSWKA